MKKNLNLCLRWRILNSFCFLVEVTFRNTYKRTKSLISLKTVASNVRTVQPLDKSDVITNPYDIANIFDNYFASRAETMEKNIHINIFQTIFQMKVVVQYFCNLIIKKK